LAVHTMYLVGLISQATFALTLAILAWSDRRTRGTMWLAIACSIQFIYSGMRAMGHGHITPRSEIFSACVLMYLVYAVFVGLRWFVQQRGAGSRRELLILSGVIAAVILLGVFSAPLAVNISRCITLAMCVRVIAMLWSPKVSELKVPARICAIILVVSMALIAFNLVASLPMEAPILAGNEAPLVATMRSITIALLAVLSFSFVGLFVAETNRRLHEETRTDVLTGLRNRRAMEEAAALAVASARQANTPLALLMLDLDHFKDLNDTFGHALGDRALRAVGVVLMSETDSREVTGRMGGEEFAVILPGFTVDQAAEVAERLRLRIANLRLHETEFSATLTVSIGVSGMRNGENAWTEMLCRADDALYRAKRGGRDRVEVASQTEETSLREPNTRTWRSKWSLPKTSL
jgi:diguanylate cyclase (GGDEF)-like protein